MELTEDNKAHIDSLPYIALLDRWRFAPTGDPWFEGATGKYWGKRIAEVRERPETDHVGASKALGWKG